MAKVTGHKRHSQRLRNLTSPATRRTVGKAVFVAGDLIGTEARRLIVENAIQGEGHVPSLPGEPPNRDTGNLDGSIATRKTGELTAETFAGGAKAPYAVDLEFGNSKIAERPYMRPATKMKRKEAAALVRAAVGKAVRRS